MLKIEGQLEIEIVRSAEAGSRVKIVSSRPLQAAKIFEGKLPAVVLAQLPLLFGICRIAQSTAGVQALQQALAIDRVTATDAARAILVQLETAREHLFRILIDWPVVLNETPDAAAMATVEPMLSSFHGALFSGRDAFTLTAATHVDEILLQAEIDKLEESLVESVFGMPTAEWLEISSLRQLDDWSSCTRTFAARLLHYVSAQGWPALGSVESSFLPELSAADLDGVLGHAGADEFIARPSWKNKTRETSALARRYGSGLIQSLCDAHGNGLLTRLVARLVELAETPATVRGLIRELEKSDPVGTHEYLSPGVGIGQIEAARGRLVHRAVVEDGIVTRYQILAPTEWNFHPAGVVADGLSKLRTTDDDELRQQAGLLIQAVDPCVAYELAVH